jgi:hypothetical protein
VRSFVHVALPSATPLFMVVQPAFPAQSAAEFVTWAQQNRGRVNYCSIGVASPSHLVAEIFRQRFELEMEHIPHRGSAPALTDTMAGNCHVLFDSGTSASPLVRQGALRALGVSAARRMPSFPNLPTIAEQGAPGFEASTWSAVIAPAGTPAPIVERLNSEIRRLIATPAEQERIAAQGGLPLDLTPAQFTAFLEREIHAWGTVYPAQETSGSTRCLIPSSDGAVLSKPWRGALWTRVLVGLKERLLAPELVAEFVQAYVAEVNAANRERGPAPSWLGRRPRQAPSPDPQSLGVDQEGYGSAGMVQELRTLEQRQAELTAQLAAAGHRQVSAGAASQPA